MLTPEQIQTLHQLFYAERWPIHKIERHLSMGLAHHQEISSSAGPAGCLACQIQ
jgi:hypothetical protein